MKQVFQDVPTNSSNKRCGIYLDKSENMRKDKALLSIVIFFSLGCIFDHLTTAYGINLSALAEMNPIVLLLMKYDLWHEIEILVITTGVCYGILVVSLRSSLASDISMKALMVSGLIRFCVGFQNLTIIIRALT